MLFLLFHADFIIISSPLHCPLLVFQTSPLVHLLVIYLWRASLGFVALNRSKSGEWAHSSESPTWSPHSLTVDSSGRSIRGRCSYPGLFIMTQAREKRAISWRLVSPDSHQFSTVRAYFVCFCGPDLRLFLSDVQPASSQPASEQCPLTVHIPYCVSPARFPHTTKVGKTVCAHVSRERTRSIGGPQAVQPTCITWDNALSHLEDQSGWPRRSLFLKHSENKTLPALLLDHCWNMSTSRQEISIEFKSSSLKSGEIFEKKCRLSLSMYHTVNICYSVINNSGRAVSLGITQSILHYGLFRRVPSSFPVR